MEVVVDDARDGVGVPHAAGGGGGSGGSGAVEARGGVCGGVEWSSTWSTGGHARAALGLWAGLTHSRWFIHTMCTVSTLSCAAGEHDPVAARDAPSSKASGKAQRIFPLRLLRKRRWGCQDYE